MIRKGDIVKIKPEWQDPGDSVFEWIARDDEEKGRVTIMPTNMWLPFPPLQTVTTDMLEPKPEPAKLETIVSRYHKIWKWEVRQNGSVLAGGYGCTKRDAANDARVWTSAKENSPGKS